MRAKASDSPTSCAPKAHALAILPGNHSIAIPFDFMLPVRPGRRSIGQGGLAGQDEAGRLGTGSDGPGRRASCQPAVPMPAASHRNLIVPVGTIVPTMMMPVMRTPVAFGKARAEPGSCWLSSRQRTDADVF